MEIALDAAGIVRSCRASGHAGAGPAGGDVVCAAVSVLARTFVRVASLQAGVTVRSSALRRGEFALSVDYAEEGRVFLHGAGCFLLEGFKSLAEEYPEFCVLRVSSLKN